MSGFIKYILGLLICFLILLYGLDILYTYSYTHPNFPRNKVSWIKKNAEEISYFDYALFGSSRCIYHLNPKIIEKKTGLKGRNLGFSGSNPFDIKLTVQQFLKYNSVKTIFVQVDGEFNKLDYDPNAIIVWLPFIHEEEIYETIREVNNTTVIEAYHDFPFYRYMAYDGFIGSRNTFLSYIKPNEFQANDGYAVYPSALKEMPTQKDIILEEKMNPHIDAIIDMCKEKNIEIVFFTAPYLNVNINTEVLEKLLPNYYDFSKIIDRPDFFGDQTHLNDKGAQLFTEMFYKTFSNNYLLLK